MPAEQILRALNGKHSKINVRCAILPKPLPYLSACLHLSLVLSEIIKKKKTENTLRELQNIFPFFNYSGWGQYVLMMSWFSECILQLCQPEQWCLLHMSGRGLVVIWASLQLVRPRAATELLPAALNYISTTGFPSPSFGVFLLVSAASLFVFDLSLFPVLFFPLPLPISSQS